MDTLEAANKVLSRIQSLDPQNASKIMGFILIQDHGDKDIIRLAHGPDALLLSLITEAKAFLGLSSNTSSSDSSPSPSSATLGPFSPRITLPQNGFRFPRSPVPGLPGSSGPLSFCGGVQSTGHRHSLGFLPSSDTNRLKHQPRNQNEVFNRKFLHGASTASVDLPAKVDSLDDFLRLKALQRQRLSTALMASSGRHPLLTYNDCMSNLNENPSLSHVGIGLSGGQSDGHPNPSSCQIYLTFPADSTFSEDDVSNYFSLYGPVQDVRIPYQQKRMFGFVTFVYPDTVKLILAKGNPHFVCDSRVLVKPYKEMGKVPDKNRKQKQNHMDVAKLPSCLGPSSRDSSEPLDIPFGPRMFHRSKEATLRRMLEQEAHLQRAIQLHSRRLMDLQLMDEKNKNKGDCDEFQAGSSPIIPLPQSPNHPNFTRKVTAKNNDSQAASKEEINSGDENSGGHKQHSIPDSSDSHKRGLENILPDQFSASHGAENLPSSTEADDDSSSTKPLSKNTPTLPGTSTTLMLHEDSKVALFPL
ncbi:hypothetical protein DM860_014814 [Cuscuta australis]|uniref:RRM domain-containing protein n=1 Tax=Cuscuta australis TaxID=267555 RepID=A0A328D333_9ASTE|nr:hypothetical protein DM860_014814 [Cuscuta australis]